MKQLGKEESYPLKKNFFIGMSLELTKFLLHTYKIDIIFLNYCCILCDIHEFFSYYIWLKFTV